MRRLSLEKSPDDVCDSLSIPRGSLLTDTIELLQYHYGVYVEAFLSKNSFTHTRRDKEYEIRVTDESGGNVSKFSTMEYVDCLVEGVRTAVRICVARD